MTNIDQLKNKTYFHKHLENIIEIYSYKNDKRKIKISKIKQIFNELI